MKSTSWDDDLPQTRAAEVSRPVREPFTKARAVKRRKVDQLLFEPSTVALPAPVAEIENVVPSVNEPRRRKVAQPAHKPVKAKPSSFQGASEQVKRDIPTHPNQSSIRSTAPVLTKAETVVTTVPAAPVAPARASVSKRKRSQVLKDEQGDGSSAGANFVYQDLKLKGGTKASKGAETLRRRIKRVRNERWREANGIRRRGKRAAAHRREQLAKELVHEKTLSEALNPNQLAEIFSSGVDTSQISLAGPSDDKDGIPDFPTCVVSRDELEDFLRTEFGHSEFREGQFEAISSVLTGERSLIILPTGSGKSLCYQFPSVFLRKKIIGFHKALTIVVSPLIALMTDQLKLLPKCCRGALIHSNISPTQVSFVHAALARGDLDVLFLAPERLIMYSMKEVLASVNVVCVAVDEAHCLSEWSHSFRPAYLSLSRIINEDIKPRSLLALTATATVQTVDSLCAVLSIHHIVRTDGISQGGSGSVQRDNLELFAKRSPNPVMDLIEFLSRPEMSRVGPMIVYVQYKWQTENVANVLRERGFGAAEPYNAGLTSDERRDVHERFMNNALRFVVATIAFGMGIDKSNLRAVIHLCLPRSVENYVQETGRASRDGQLGHCRCFFNTDDYMRVRNKAVSEAIRKEGVDNLVKLILEKREANQLFFVPESIELVNKGHMSLLLSLLESEGLLACVFQGFPKILKLRFFASTIDELAPIDPFVDVLFRSPAETKQGQRGGVASVDLVSAVLKSDVSPPLFMHKLGQAAKAQKFSIAKSDWGHIVAPRQGYGDKDVPALVERVFTKAIANHHLEMNRLDSSFALMSRIAAQSIDDDRIGHKLIQLYFAAEERFPNGEDLVPSILAGAPEALTRNILREIDNIRNDSVN